MEKEPSSEELYDLPDTLVTIFCVPLTLAAFFAGIAFTKSFWLSVGVVVLAFPLALFFIAPFMARLLWALWMKLRYGKNLHEGTVHFENPGCVSLVIIIVLLFFMYGVERRMKSKTPPAPPPPAAIKK